MMNLISSVDINGSNPELIGAIPRSEMRGKLFLNVVNIEMRKRKHSEKRNMKNEWPLLSI